MTTATTDSKGAALPAGVIWDVGSNAYWVRADYTLDRSGRGSGWVLTDCDTLAERTYRSESAGIAALAKLA